MRFKTAVAATAIAGAVATGLTGFATTADAAVSHLTHAHNDWVNGSHAISANGNLYLKAAEHQLAAYGNRYYHERADLVALTKIPETDTTAHQRAVAARDTRELNGFFHTPNLYGVAQGNARNYARGDWQESGRVSSAESNVWLAAAVDELDAYGSKYNGAIADLHSLESIPETSTTAHQRAVAHKDIVALDKFFNTPGFDL